MENLANLRFWEASRGILTLAYHVGLRNLGTTYTERWPYKKPRETSDCRRPPGGSSPWQSLLAQGVSEPNIPSVGPTENLANITLRNSSRRNLTSAALIGLGSFGTNYTEPSPHWKPCKPCKLHPDSWARWLRDLICRALALYKTLQTSDCERPAGGSRPWQSLLAQGVKGSNI